MAVFVECSFVMAVGGPREFVVRESEIWRQRNLALINAAPPSPPYMLVARDIELRNASALPDDGEAISASEFPIGAEVQVEDWAAEQDVILRAAADGFHVVRVSDWPPAAPD